MDNLNIPKCYGCLPSLLDGTEKVVNVDLKVKLPDEFDLRTVMPPVRNLGNTLTCVCQAMTGLLDFLENSKTGKSGICNNFNIDELYRKRSNYPQEGMSIKEAMHIVKKDGLNGSHINGYALVPSSILLKHSLVMFGPVLIGTGVYSTSSLYFWRKNLGAFLGGHCTMIVAYSDKRNSFLVRNSWGNSWAQNGHTWMQYDEFADAIFEAWTCIL